MQGKMHPSQSHQVNSNQNHAAAANSIHQQYNVGLQQQQQLPSQQQQHQNSYQLHGGNIQMNHLNHDNSDKTSVDVNLQKMRAPLPVSKHKKKRIQVNAGSGSNGRDWDEGFTSQNMPDYKVYEDKYCQGYIGILKKKKRYNLYMNAIKRPGGIRPARRFMNEIGGQQESMYSDNSPAKIKQRSGSQSGSQVVINRVGVSNNFVPSSNQQVSKASKLRVAISQNRKSNNQQDVEINEDTQAYLINELQKIWNHYQIPNWHRIKFMENLQNLNPKIVCPIIAKEIQDFTKEHSLVQRVEVAIRAREECIKQIDMTSMNDFGATTIDSQQEENTNPTPSQQIKDKLNHLAAQLTNLRHLSIYTVEQIAQWRDQLRYLALLNSQNKAIKKHKLLPSAQIPYLTSQGINYLVKMKTDTNHFCTLSIAKYFNFSESSRVDPFLISCSLQQKSQLAAGSGIRAIKQGKINKPNDDKIILLVPDNLMSKARACEEVILMERGDLRPAVSSQSVRQVNQQQNSDQKMISLKPNQQQYLSQTEEKENQHQPRINPQQIQQQQHQHINNNSNSNSKVDLQKHANSHQNHSDLNNKSGIPTIPSQKRILAQNQQQHVNTVQQTHAKKEQEKHQKPQHEQSNYSLPVDDDDVKIDQQVIAPQKIDFSQVQKTADKQPAIQKAQEEVKKIDNDSKPADKPQELAPIQEPEQVNFKLEPLGLKESEFPLMMKNYMSTLDVRMLQSFYDCDLLVQKQDNGYERHYLKLINEKTNQQEGIAIFNIDHTMQNEQRAFIRHVSTKNFSYLQQALTQVMDYIWKYVDCSNIRVEIYHQKDEASGKIQADPDIKNAFTKCGFKWKTLSNDPVTGKRAQVMQANRPPNGIAFDQAHRNIKSGQEPITIKAGMIMKLEKQDPDNYNDYDGDMKEPTEACLISCLLGGLKQYKEEKNVVEKFQTLNSDKRDEGVQKIMGLADNLAKEVQFSAQRSMITENYEDIEKILTSQGLNLQNRDHQGSYLASILSLVARWPPFDFIQHNGFYYQRVKSKQIMRVSYIEKQSKLQKGTDLVIIPTDDEKLKIIIIPQAVISDNCENLMIEVQHILKNCEISKAKSDEVLIPSFKIEINMEYKDFNGVKIDDQNLIKDCQKVISIETSKGKQSSAGLKFDINPSLQYILDQPFIIALSDAELEEQIDNLPLLVAKVNKQNWIKY
eukprot:403334687